MDIQGQLGNGGEAKSVLPVEYGGEIWRGGSLLAELFGILLIYWLLNIDAACEFFLDIQLREADR